MAWHTIEEAVDELNTSRRTLERRVAAGGVASYVDELGRRLVWTGPEPDVPLWVEDLLARVEDLQRAVEGLRGARAKQDQSVEAPGDRRAARLSRPSKNTARAVTPSGRKPPAHAISEAEVERLMELRAQVELGDKDLQRQAGLASNWFWKVRRGKCRSAYAAAGWTRLETFLAARVAA